MRVLLPGSVNASADAVLELLQKYQTIAVVGLSVPPVVESAIRVAAKVIWMQLGIENDEAAEKARSAGLVVIEDACILVEHRRRTRELK